MIIAGHIQDCFLFYWTLICNDQIFFALVDGHLWCICRGCLNNLRCSFCCLSEYSEIYNIFTKNDLNFVLVYVVALGLRLSMDYSIFSGLITHSQILKTPFLQDILNSCHEAIVIGLKPPQKSFRKNISIFLAAGPSQSFDMIKLWEGLVALRNIEIFSQNFFFGWF